MRNRKEDSQRNTVVLGDLEERTKAALLSTKLKVRRRVDHLLSLRLPLSCELSLLSVVPQSRPPRSEQSSLRILAGCRRIHSHFVPTVAAEFTERCWEMADGGKEERRRDIRSAWRQIFLKFIDFAARAMFHD